MTLADSAKQVDRDRLNDNLGKTLSVFSKATCNEVVLGGSSHLVSG